MYRYVSLERWAALRALRDGEALTFPRLAAASDLNVTTIRDPRQPSQLGQAAFPKPQAEGSMGRPRAGRGGGRDDDARPY